MCAGSSPQGDGPRIILFPGFVFQVMPVASAHSVAISSRHWRPCFDRARRITSSAQKVAGDSERADVKLSRLAARESMKILSSVGLRGDPCFD